MTTVMQRRESGFKTNPDYKILFDVLEGKDVEAGLKHFRDKVEPAAADYRSAL